MTRFRALLLGVADYDDSNVPPLPFVIDGLSEVGAALESRGYVIEPDSGSENGRITRTQLLTRVQRFLVEAGRGDTLLIFLSGHGAHSDDVDYLVPSDASSAWPHLAEMCVAVNAWANFVEDTPAANVIFLIDACREGFDEHAMSGFGRNGWSQGKGLQVERRNVAYIFACAPGGLARYVHGDEGFSLFARAVQLAAGDPEGPSRLSDFRATLDRLMQELAVTHGKPGQQVRVRTECEQNAFVILPPGRRAADRDGWPQLVAGHAAWECAAGQPGEEEIRALTGQLVEQLTAIRREVLWAVRSDPWRDTALARRMNGHVEFLLTRTLGKLELSPAEAALLVVIPMVYETHWARQAMRFQAVSPADLSVQAGADADRASFERFAHSYPRHVRRARNIAATSTEAAPQIGWWLFNQWLARRPESYEAQEFESLLTPVCSERWLAAEVFNSSRVSELARCLVNDPGILTRTDRPDALLNRRTIAAQTAAEQNIRERLIGYILAVAHYLAIEVIRLPEIIADHIGISDPVSPEDVYSTVALARWLPRGHTRVLSAPCRHPAVEFALQRHTQDLDALLGDAHRLADSELDLAPLSGMPIHASADLVEPVISIRGGPAYTSAGVRFRLAEDRIQELLMGEQLYGERYLAIRELYQNALDACRYRKARMEYLQRQNMTEQIWRGDIKFLQGINEDGWPYLDCIDNGIGMGIRELADVFARAGTRFADLPEFLEEQADWSRLEPPIKIYPNSRFGIGVLSYFMLADEISITTCRLGRDGRPTERLQVFIAGPGNLFRIRPLGAGVDAGTTVRLLLRPDQDIPLVTKVLSQILWVAEFESSARDSTGELTWPAGDLPLFAAEELIRDSAKEFSNRPGKIISAAGLPVWWCDGPGMILTDGITSRKGTFGAVVDLTGELAPALSVDRRTIRNYQLADVEGLLNQAVPALLASNSHVVNLRWICSLAQEMPTAADLVTRSAIDTGRTWEVAGKEVSARRAGCISIDRRLLGVREPSGDLGVAPRQYPNWLSAWRATACGLFPNFADAIYKESIEVIPALPSDVFALACGVNGKSPWLDPDQPVPLHHLIAAAVRLRRSPAQIAERLTALGYRLPDTAGLPDDLTSDDTSLINRNHDADAPLGDREDGQLRDRELRYQELRYQELRYQEDVDPSWLDSDQPVPLGHLIMAAVRLRRSPAKVAERLTALGYRPPDTAGLPDDLTSDDTSLISRNNDADARVGDRGNVQVAWLDPDQPVPLQHLIMAAARLRRTPAQIAERLTALGYRPPDITGLPDHFTSDDTTLISRDLDSNSPWLDPDQPAPLSHLILAAARLSRTPAQVAERLTALSYSPPDISRLPNDLTSDDAALVRRDLDERADWPREEPPSWLDPDQPVPLSHLIIAAARLSRTPAQIAERLTALGFSTADISGLSNHLTSDDVTLISYSLRAEASWPDPAISLLDPDQPVPLRHLLMAAVRLHRTPAQVAERLTALGYRPPDPAGLPDDLTSDDTILISHELKEKPRVQAKDGPSFLDPDQPVPLRHLIMAAVRLRRTPAQIAERLTALGYRPSDPVGLPDGLTSDDTTLISRDLNGNSPWLDPDQPALLSHLIIAAARLSRTPTQIAERLTALGYEIPNLVELLPRMRPGADG